MTWQKGCVEKANRMEKIEKPERMTTTEEKKNEKKVKKRLKLFYSLPHPSFCSLLSSASFSRCAPRIRGDGTTDLTLSPSTHPPSFSLIRFLCPFLSLPSLLQIMGLHGRCPQFGTFWSGEKRRGGGGEKKKETFELQSGCWVRSSLGQVRIYQSIQTRIEGRRRARPDWLYFVLGVCGDNPRKKRRNSRNGAYPRGAALEPSRHRGWSRGRTTEPPVWGSWLIIWFCKLFP